MAVSVQQLTVSIGVLATLTQWNNVVDVHQVRNRESRVAACTDALLRP